MTPLADDATVERLRQEVTAARQRVAVLKGSIGGEQHIAASMMGVEPMPQWQSLFDVHSTCEQLRSDLAFVKQACNRLLRSARLRSLYHAPRQMLAKGDEERKALLRSLLQLQQEQQHSGAVATSQLLHHNQRVSPAGALPLLLPSARGVIFMQCRRRVASGREVSRAARLRRRRLCARNSTSASDSTRRCGRSWGSCRR